jgi:hypothetical protein
MTLLMNIQRTVTLGAHLIQHHLFHHEWDFQREWHEGEVFVRCQRCGLRSHGMQIGPPRLTTQLAGHAVRRRLRTSV